MVKFDTNERSEKLNTHCILAHRPHPRNLCPHHTHSWGLCSGGLDTETAPDSTYSPVLPQICKTKSKYHLQIYCVFILSDWILLGDTHDSQLHLSRPHSHCLCRSASCEGCSGGWNKWTDWRDTFQAPVQDIWIHRCCQSSRCAHHSAMLRAHSVYWHRWMQSASKCGL